MGDGSVVPKSLRPVAGRPILLHALDALSDRGLLRTTLIVGYGAQQIRAAVGERRGNMSVDYVMNKDYASTEHGWSLFLARDAWQRHRQSVVFMDADNAFDTALLDRLLAARTENTVLVDPALDTSERDEELVLGRDGRVTGLVRGRVEEFPDCVGGFVGMNCFTAAFMRDLFEYMEAWFGRHGGGFKYERVFHGLLRHAGVRMHYLDTGGLEWVNVNHLEELAVAERILSGLEAR